MRLILGIRVMFNTTGVDGAHRKVRQGPHREERQEAAERERARRRLGPRHRGPRLHGLQEESVHHAQPEGESLQSTLLVTKVNTFTVNRN